MVTFDAAGRSFVRAVLDLAFEYQLPLGLEYVDREAMERPLALNLSNKRVADILRILVAQMSQYRLELGRDVLEIYSPRARAEGSNLLNTTISDFRCLDQSPRMASAEVYSTMMSQIHAPCCAIGNVMDTGHPRTVSVNLRMKRVYEIMDTIVGENGESLWVVVVPPEKLSTPGAQPWEVYGLGPGWENLVLGDLSRAFKGRSQPTPSKPRPRSSQ